MPTRLDNFRPSSLPVFLGNNCHHPHIPGLRAPAADSQVSDPSKTLNTAAKNPVQRRHPPKPRTHIKARRSASCTPNYGHHDFVGFDPMSRPTEVTPLLNPVYSEPDADTREDLRKAQTSRMSMFGEELKTLLQYTGPIFGTHISEYALVIIPVICIGRDSTTGLAAFTLASMFAMITGFSIVKGFISSLDTVLPSTWTSAHPELAALWTQRLVIVMAGSLIPILILWFNAEPILSMLRQDPEISHLASLYLRWISLGLPAYTFNFISRRYYKSQGQFSVPTKITFVVAVIDALLTYLLVLAPTPLKLGFVGAPIATALSFNIISVLFLVHGSRVQPRPVWQPFSWESFNNLGVLFYLGLCGVGQIGLRLWAWELLTLASTFLGPVSLASQSILVISAATVFRTPFSLGIAVSVRIGNLLGEKDAERAGTAARAALALVVVISAFTGIFVMIFAKYWAHLFNRDPEIISTVAKIMPLISLFQIFHSTSAVTGAIARARGKQITGALVNLGAYYIIGFPVGIYLAFSRGYGLYGLWIGMTISLIYCAATGLYLCLRVDWDSEVQKVMKRLQSDKIHCASADPPNSE